MRRTAFTIIVVVVGVILAELVFGYCFTSAIGPPG